jgi:hypothetical protein
MLSRGSTGPGGGHSPVDRQVGECRRNRSNRGSIELLGRHVTGNGVCQITVGLMRPMGWVGVALVIYILVASHNELLALGVSLLILLCSAPLFGIITQVAPYRFLEI